MLSFSEFLNLFIWLDPNETKSKNYNKKVHNFWGLKTDYSGGILERLAILQGRYFILF